MLATSAVKCQSSHTRGCGDKRARHVSETNIDAGDINVQKRMGIVSPNSHQTTDLASGGCQISPLLLRKRCIWKYKNQSEYDFLFGFGEGIKALTKLAIKKGTTDLWASDFSAKKKMQKMGDSLDETEHFYFTAGWIFAVQFILPGAKHRSLQNL